MPCKALPQLWWGFFLPMPHLELTPLQISRLPAPRLLQQLKTALGDAYPEQEAGAVAIWALEEITRKNRAWLLAGGQLDIPQAGRLLQVLPRLLRHEPVQYIFGTATFAGLPLRVAAGVLIPRPETEEMALLIARQYASSGLQVLDVGTGSGCLAITLALRLKNSKVTAVDISGAALQIARENAKNNGATINFVQTDILKDELAGLPPLDLLVSNPPYVRQQEKAEMQPNVLTWEPEAALFVPDHDPLVFYRKIAWLASKRLKPGGTVWVEINEALPAETAAVFTSQLPGSNVEVLDDFHGKPRFVRCTTAHEM